MKYALICLILLLGCKLVLPPKSEKKYRFTLELNTSKYDFLGIPIKSEESELRIVSSNKEPREFVVDSFRFVFYPTNGKTLNFHCQSTSYQIWGSFLVPKYRQITYIQRVNPVTMLSDTLTPLEVICPLRTGTWKFLNNSKLDSITYNPKINELIETQKT